MGIVFGREEKIAVILLLAVIAASGTICFVLDIKGKESFASPYGPLSETGDLVFYEGKVDEIIYTNTGGHLIVKSGDATVFISNGVVPGIKPEPGMWIHATGTVEIYKGEQEIYVSDPADAIFVNSSSPG